MRLFVFYIAIISFLSLNAFAVTYKESAKVTYNKFSGSKKQEVIDQAYNEACKKGLKKYTNTFDEKTYQIYRKVKNQIEGNLYDYIICDILDDNQDKKAKTYTIVVKVEILERDLNALLIDENTDTGETTSSAIVIVPFALEVTSAQSFDTKEYDRKDTSNTEDASQIQATDGTETISNSEVNTSETTTTGGSDTVKSDLIKSSFAENQTNDFTKAIINDFVFKGFDILHVYDLFDDEISDLYDQIKLEIEETGEPNQRSLSKIKGLIKKYHSDVGYFIYAKVYIGQKNIDQSTGNVKISAQVTGEIVDLNAKRPIIISAVGPIVYSGLGENQDEAKANAIKITSKESAIELINILGN